ncbi:MAG TPA: cupredoxin domain-containing protein [Nitrospiria bacterium]|nr:cupredoxin domain-containing protein [Nitrospiria bacterium]
MQTMRTLAGSAIVVAAMAAAAVVMGSWSGTAGGEEPSQTVDITIRDSAFKVETRVLRLQAPIRIVLHNTDKIEHGFTSPGLAEVDVRVEAHGVVTYGRGIKGLYVGPGEEAAIIFEPHNAGALKFSCDLHPQMKGELAVLTIGAA